MNNNMNENTKATNATENTKSTLETQGMNNEAMFKNNVSLDEMEAIVNAGTGETATPETGDIMCHKYDKKMQMGTFYGGINSNNNYKGKVIRFKISGMTDGEMTYISQTLALSIKQIPLGTTIGNPYTLDFTGADSVEFCINVDNIIDKSRIIKLANHIFDHITHLMIGRENTLSINILREIIK